MARAKDSALTLEEKLAQALVPVEEQPYEVPENWCWVHLLYSFDNQTDSKKKIQQKAYLDKGDIAIVDQGQETIGGYTDDISMVYTGRLPVIVFGDHTRCIKYIDYPFAQGADGIKVLVPKEFYLSKAFYYALHSLDIPNMGYRRHYPLFKNYYISVPPLPEQHRIVGRIERLFAELDEAKEKAQAVIDGYEDRKAAILHRAFTGELTEEWRRETGLTMDDWSQIPWNDFIISIEAGKNWNADGRPPRDGEFGVVKVSAVTWGEFIEDESKTCRLAEQWNERVQIHTGDFLFSRANTLQLVGNCVIVSAISKRLMLSDKILRLSFSDVVVPRYVLHFTRSDFYRKQIEDLATGNQDGMRNVSQSQMRRVTFPIPTLPEQHEIVRLLDSMLTKESSAKSAAERAISQIDTMKKSILARAFRGELGTNDPEDEPAIELLKRVLEESK